MAWTYAEIAGHGQLMLLLLLLRRVEKHVEGRVALVTAIAVLSSTIRLDDIIWLHVRKT